jgi:hypothetical protein
MESELIVRGKVIGTKQSTFEGKTSNAIQLLKRNSRNAMELLNVKLADTMDPAKYPEGATVEWSVDVGSYESSLFFKAVRDLKAERASSKATAA